MSSKPCDARSRTMCSIIGRFATGIIGFGWLLVSGRSRVPSPPARVTAFMLASSCRGLTRGTTLTQCGAGHRDVERGCVVAEDESADREEPGDDLDDVARD